jgi:hypothetical protein
VRKNKLNQNVEQIIQYNYIRNKNRVGGTKHDFERKKMASMKEQIGSKRGTKL